MSNAGIDDALKSTAPKTTPPEDWPERISLCLSGGGLRATFYHLGVIRALRELGLLNRVNYISAVSGGSILAAHLVLRWSEYNGGDQAYLCMEHEIRAFGATDIRGRIVRRWLLGIFAPFLRLFGYRYRRTDILEHQYDLFFNKAMLPDLAGTIDAPKPEIHFLSTSFTTGNLCSFSKEGLWIDDGKETKLIRTVLPVALAVAASSAFPPLFPPIPITRKRLDATEMELPFKDYLSDGGVFDNLGFDKFSRMKFSQDVQPQWALLSDAGARFDWDVKRRFSWIVSRTVRATDILMKRLDERTLATITAGSVHAIHLPISLLIDKEPSKILPINLQRRLAKIRTDLDSFSPNEIELLIWRGYEVCRDRLRELTPISRSGPSSTRLFPRPTYDGPATMAAVKSLDRSDVRSLSVFNAKDLISYPLVIWLFILVAAAPVFLWISATNIEQQSAETDAILQQAQSALKEAEATNRLITIPDSSGESPTLAPKPLVLVQFAGVIARDEMQRMKSILVQHKWRVLGNDNGGIRTPAAAGLNEVRYKESTFRESAAQLAKTVEESIRTSRSIRTVQTDRASPEALEVWISR